MEASTTLISMHLGEVKQILFPVVAEISRDVQIIPWLNTSRYFNYEG
jgi:hypothetical protein